MKLAPQETRTYMITVVTAERRSIFQVTAVAELFEQTLLDYRRQGKFLLHAFVIMPDHFRALITPASDVSPAPSGIWLAFADRETASFSG